MYSGDVRYFAAYTDGGSRGNPGPSASAFVLFEVLLSGERKHIITKGFYIGVQTNNYAEYDAVERLAVEMNQRGLHSVRLTIFSDSMLTVQQLMGGWQIKNNVLKAKAADIGLLFGTVGTVSLHHVARNMNREADKAVNVVLDLQDSVPTESVLLLLRWEREDVVSALGVSENFSNL